MVSLKQAKKKRDIQTIEEKKKRLDGWCLSGLEVSKAVFGSKVRNNANDRNYDNNDDNTDQSDDEDILWQQ